MPSRMVTAIVGLVVLLLAVGCTGSGIDENQTTISYNGTEPENALIPGDTTESGGIKVIGALFRGLVEYDARTAEPRNAVGDDAGSVSALYHRALVEPERAMLPHRLDDDLCIRIEACAVNREAGRGQAFTLKLQLGRDL